MSCDGGGFFKALDFGSLTSRCFWFWCWLIVQVLVKRQGNMEANFSLITDGQMPAFRGLISSNTLMNVFRVDGEDFWRVVQLIFGEEFLVSDCWPRTNLGILSLFVALALSVGMSMEEVQQVASLVLQPKWVGGLNDVVARVVVG